MDEIDFWNHHFWRGIESGFPLCCIIWFNDSHTNVLGSFKDSLFEKIFREELLTNKTLKIPSIEGRYGRAMCPLCLLNAFIKFMSSDIE